MQLDGHVADCVGEVPADEYAQAVTVACYQLDVEELARVKLNARQEDESSGGVVLGDDGEDMLGGEVRRVVGGGCDGDEGGGGDVVVGELRLDGVLVLCEFLDGMPAATWVYSHGHWEMPLLR